ncbi:MAG: SPW repeat protein [Candidatus Colwellbacteria bacterium]|nr:SPW repeat protein [Candidatus Colwellbacteria bacterium]
MIPSTGSGQVPWTKWLMLTVGVWVAVSPFVAEQLGVNSTQSNVLSGAVIFTLALWDLFQEKV